MKGTRGLGVLLIILGLACFTGYTFYPKDESGNVNTDNGNGNGTETPVVVPPDNNNDWKLRKVLSDEQETITFNEDLKLEFAGNKIDPKTEVERQYTATVYYKGQKVNTNLFTNNTVNCVDIYKVQNIYVVYIYKMASIYGQILIIDSTGNVINESYQSTLCLMDVTAEGFNTFKITDNNEGGTGERIYKVVDNNIEPIYDAQETTCIDPFENK